MNYLKPGDLIKHKRADTRAVVTRVFKGKKEMVATVLFSNEMNLCTAPLKLLQDNWEVISEI